jgi:hypothetical protein
MEIFEDGRNIDFEKNAEDSISSEDSAAARGGGSSSSCVVIDGIVSTWVVGTSVTTTTGKAAGI